MQSIQTGKDTQHVAILNTACRLKRCWEHLCACGAQTRTVTMSTQMDYIRGFWRTFYKLFILFGGLRFSENNEVLSQDLYFKTRECDLWRLSYQVDRYASDKN